MNNYLKAVTLGAFTWNNGERISLLLENTRKAGLLWLVVHFILLTICLNFPVVFQIARLSPSELYGRLYSTQNWQSAENTETEQTYPENFDELMIDSNYSRNVLLPVLGLTFGLIVIIQVVFFILTVVFLGFSRMQVTPISFSDRIGLALYSSTLPVFIATIFGLYLPTVHIIICYFIIILIVFKRSNLCPDG